MTITVDGDLGLNISGRKYYEENNSATFNGVPQLPTPDGSIIESGENANGTYIKYADGTLVCQHRVSTIDNITTVAGSLYSCTPVIWTFPAPFINNDVAISASDSSSTAVFFICTAISVSASVRGYCYTPVASLRDAAVTAIGRWRA